jgi:hypothetical protein
MELSPADGALLDEAARRVVELRMAVPAMMFLESIAPMNLVTANMLHLLTPVLGMALAPGLLERVALLLERRERSRPRAPIDGPRRRAAAPPDALSHGRRAMRIRSILPRTAAAPPPSHPSAGPEG